MTIFDRLYKWVTRTASPSTTVHSRNCVGHIHEDFVGFVVQISRCYLGNEVYFSKRFFNFASARSCTVAMTEAISNLRLGDPFVTGLPNDIVVKCYRLLLLRKIRTLLFPLTSKSY